MKFHVNNKEYKFSPKATMWSRIGGTILGSSFVWLILFTLLIYRLFEAIWPGSKLVFVSIILALVLVVGLVLFCSRMEAKCVKRDFSKHMQFSEPIDEPK